MIRMWLSVARRLGKKPVRFAVNSSGEAGAGGEQPVVCPGVVVRHGAVGKQVGHRRYQPVARMSTAICGER